MDCERVERAGSTGRHFTRDGWQEEVRRLRATLVLEAWGQWIGRVPWDTLWTLTFDPVRVKEGSRCLADHEGTRWCGLLGYLSRRPVGWVLATELGRGGAWHAHVLTVGLARAMRPVAADVWKCRNGFVEARDVHNPTGAVLYTSKKAAAEGHLMFSDTLDRYLPVQATGQAGPVLVSSAGPAERRG